MTVKEFLKETYKFNTIINLQESRPRVYCKDGFNISIQGSKLHYCAPCKNGYEFTNLELGFPSEEDEIINDYMDDYEGNPCETTYSYVPIEVVENLINKHGGIDHY